MTILETLEDTAIDHYPVNEQKYYEYEEALSKCMEYFNNDELASKVFLDKYALRDQDQKLLEATPDQMHRRIAKEFARIEAKKFSHPMTEDEIFSYLDKFRQIIPQGSPMYGIGNTNQLISLSNCFVVDSPSDAYSGIMKTDEQIVQISKRRGGVGVDISNLRPNGAATRNAARTSTGIISFAERYSNSIREVGQSGRRGALMLTLSVHHPEILDFAKVKRDLNKVTGANISVRLTDEFLNAVDKGEQYEQRWPVDARENGEEPKVSQMVDAKEVWMQIIENAHAMAEPGLLFWDNIISESPADCYADVGYKTLTTNPCGEIPLSKADSCRLLLLNTYGFVNDPYTNKAKFDFDSFHQKAQIAQRLMDDMIDLELEAINNIIKKVKSDPEDKNTKSRELELWQEIKQACIGGRRTGTGITGLGDTIAALNMEYGSNKSINFADKLYRTLKLGCYRSSVDMAKELGTFPVWDHEKEKNNPYLLRIKDEDPDLWNDMKKHGRRNISLLTTAPAGSVSILCQTTSGIEPLFMFSYTRRKKINPSEQGVRVDFTDQSGDSWQNYEVYHRRIHDWVKVTGYKASDAVEKSPWAGCCAEDLDWKQRVKLQAAATKNIDHSISSTLNLPENINTEEVAAIYEMAWKSGCKGITIYRKNCRSGVLVETKKEDTRENNGIVKTHAPKRPKELPCDVHHISVKGQEYFVLVGLLNGEPYEVFAGINGTVSKKIKSGVIKKLKRGLYNAVFDDDSVMNDITAIIGDDQEAITRLVSSTLRHGTDINFLVHQLEKVKGDLQSFSKALGRALKKHINDGSKVTGESCPNCNHEPLVRQEGCVLCQNCSWTKCS